MKGIDLVERGVQRFLYFYVFANNFILFFTLEQTFYMALAYIYLDACAKSDIKSLVNA